MEARRQVRCCPTAAGLIARGISSSAAPRYRRDCAVSSDQKFSWALLGVHALTPTLCCVPCSCVQNQTPCVWWVDDGKRMGTFEGHTGAVWSCDMTCELQPYLSLSLMLTCHALHIQSTASMSMAARCAVFHATQGTLIAWSQPQLTSQCACGTCSQGSNSLCGRWASRAVPSTSA